MRAKWLIGLILVVVAHTNLATTMTHAKSERERVAGQVIAVAAEAGDDWFYYVYSAILWNETRFQHNTVNYNIDGSHDFGIAQLNSKYWDRNREYWGYDIRTATGNARVGALFFKSLLIEFDGNYSNSIMAYNCGPGAVRSGRIPNCTRKYLDRVMTLATLNRAFSRD